MKSPRIAILGFAIESNRFAPVSTRADFVTRAYLQDVSLLDDARSDAPVMTPEIPAFVRTMDALLPWTPMPILFANAESGGPAQRLARRDSNGIGRPVFRRGAVSVVAL
jgi:microcystin degradation protein MlrC